MKSLNEQPNVKRSLELSKTRCQIQHGLQPNISRPVMRLQSAELNKQRQQFFETIGGNESKFDKASLLPDKSRYCLLISDANGVVIESYAPDGYDTEFQRYGITAGGLWNEQVAGTNAIDMALRTGKITTVSDVDHFHRCFFGFGCSSSPLCDAQNNTIGTITLVGSAKRRVEEIALCENILRKSAHQFQSRLFRSYYADKMTARLSSRSTDGLLKFETMVACDESGNVITSIPLRRDRAYPVEHQGIEGRHLSELRDLTINVRGPSMIPPRRNVVQGAMVDPLPIKIKPSRTVNHYAKQGAGFPAMVERARKLVAHRVPLLLCGEPGVGKSDFAKAILEDLGLNSPFAFNIDCTKLHEKGVIDKKLNDLRFLCEYPIENCIPALILHNADQLGVDEQQLLEKFLFAIEPQDNRSQLAVHPVLIFTTDQTWQSIDEGGTISKNLLYLMGQSVMDIPPLRKRNLEQVLNGLITRELDGKLEISEQAMEVLTNYDWPGNFREMRAVIREAQICGNGKRINLIDLPERLSISQSKQERSNLKMSLSEALDSTDWNVTKAAKLLSKSRATVNRWIVEQDLKRPD